MKNPTINQGFTLFEAIIATGLFSSIALLEVRYLKSEFEQSHARNFGQQLAIYNNGVRAYIAENAGNFSQGKINISINHLKAGCSPGSTASQFVPCSFDPFTQLGIAYQTEIEVDENIIATTRIDPIIRGGNIRKDLTGLAALTALNFSTGNTGTGMTTSSSISMDQATGDIILQAVNNKINDPWLRIDGGNNMEAPITFDPTLLPEQREIVNNSRIYNKDYDNKGRPVIFGDKTHNAHLEIDGNFEVEAVNSIQMSAKNSLGQSNSPDFSAESTELIDMNSGDNLLYTADGPLGAFKLTAGNNIEWKAGQSFSVESQQNTRYQADANLHLKAANNILLDASSDINIDAGKQVKFNSSTANINLSGHNQVHIQSAANIDTYAANRVDLNAGKNMDLIAAEGLIIESTEADIVLNSDQNSVYRANNDILISAQDSIQGLSNQQIDFFAASAQLSAEANIETESINYQLNSGDDLSLSSGNTALFESTAGSLFLDAPNNIQSLSQSIDAQFTQDIALTTSDMENLAAGELDIYGTRIDMLGQNIKIDASPRGKKTSLSPGFNETLSLYGAAGFKQSAANIFNQASLDNQYLSHQQALSMDGQSVEVRTSTGNNQFGANNIYINTTASNGQNEVVATTRGSIDISADNNILLDSSSDLIFHASKGIDIGTPSSDTEISSAGTFHLAASHFSILPNTPTTLFSSPSQMTLKGNDFYLNSDNVTIDANYHGIFAAKNINVHPGSKIIDFSVDGPIYMEGKHGAVNINNTNPAFNPGDIIFNVRNDLIIDYNKLTISAIEGELEFESKSYIDLTINPLGLYAETEGYVSIGSELGTSLQGASVNLESTDASDFKAKKNINFTETNTDPGDITFHGYKGSKESFKFTAQAEQDLSVESMYQIYTGQTGKIGDSKTTARIHFSSGDRDGSTETSTIGSAHRKNFYSGQLNLNHDTTQSVQFVDLDGHHTRDLNNNPELTNDNDLLVDGVEVSQATGNIYKKLDIIYESSKNALVRSDDAKVFAEDALSSGKKAVENTQEYERAEGIWSDYNPGN